MIHSLKIWFDKIPISKNKKEVLNLPNTITLLRIGVIPILFLLLFSPGKILSLIIAFLFILAAVTDFLDGYIARKYNIITDLGKFLDPVADKIIVSTAMILMIPVGRIPAWIVAIIVIRDVFVDGLRSMASAHGLIIAAGPLGKQKTICQLIAVSALLIHYPIFGVDAHSVGMVILYLALILTVWSGADYFARYHRGVLQQKKD